MSKSKARLLLAAGMTFAGSYALAGIACPDPLTPVTVPDQCVQASCHSGTNPYPIQGWKVVQESATNGGCILHSRHSAYSCAETVPYPVVRTFKHLEPQTYECWDETDISTTGCRTETPAQNFRKGESNRNFPCDYCTGT